MRDEIDQVYTLTTNNPDNQYTQIVTGANTASVSYDAAGNLTLGPGDYEYEYDHDNRLTQIVRDEASVAEFSYDALGRRVETIRHETSGDETTRYFYDGWRVLVETDSSHDAERAYVYGNYLDEVVLQTAFGTPDEDRYPAHDHLYSTVCVFGAAGVVAEYVEYDAYGRARYHVAAGADDTWLTADDDTADDSSVGNPVGFTGQRLDVLNNGDLRLMSYKNRVYDPDTGRFLQRDPEAVAVVRVDWSSGHGSVRLDVSAFTPTKQYGDGLSIYEYALSRPVSVLDPSGRGAVVLGITVYTYGQAAANALLGCYCCYKWNKCWREQQEQIEWFKRRWESQLEGLDEERYGQVYDRGMKHLAGMLTNSPCWSLGRCCGKHAVQTGLWIAGKYVAIKVFIKS